LRWVMASSFIYSSIDIGVVTGSRKLPLTSCTQRVTEPLIRIPKSGIITWFRLAGQEETLAIVNVHAINFALTLGGYRAQLEALGAALEHHPGPIIFAGDLNTWTDARNEAMRAVAARLGMTEIAFKEDRRTLFMGKQLDHIYVRGLEVSAADAIPVTSSDHNPVRATLRVARVR
jgi:endonuclease/exonuclease/phosphatase (EEP) superfamily protein YafD